MISNRKTGDRVEQAVFLLLIALSLALDAFAVSVSSGVAVPGFGPAQALKLGVWFGAFQFAMPLAGWLLGAGVSAYVEAADHWIAFALLALIGGRMAAGALVQGCGTQARPEPAALTPGRLTALAVATSIDALAVGVSLTCMEVDILAAAGVIGAVAFCLSVLGGLLGRRLGCLFQRRAELAGGIVLILIGGRILIEHLTGG